MYRYVLRRLFLMIPIILGVSFVIFSILAITPGDPASRILGVGASQEAIDQLNHELGQDLPFIERYFTYLYNALVKRDFGTSYMKKTPVFNEVFSRLPTSILVASLALICASCIGIPIGVLSAVKQYSLLDTLPTVIALFLAAVPGFWLGMMFLLLFSLKLGWLPSSGTGTWQHFIMPMFSLGLPYAARQLRFTRSSMLETIRQDYVRTARAKGASERAVIWKHAMKNALLPVITVVGNDFSGLLGGAIVTETLYGIPGLGSLIVNAIKQKDIPIVMAATLFLATIFSFIMLSVDILYAYVDPRIKAKYANERR